MRFTVDLHQDVEMAEICISCNRSAAIRRHSVPKGCRTLQSKARTPRRLRSDSMNERMRVMQRQPRRISITLSYQVHEALLTRSEEEGRSLSNLCAFLLEEALRDATRLLLDSKPAVGKTAALVGGNGHVGLRRDSQPELWRQRT